MVNFILKKKKQSFKINPFLTADFETVVIKKKHYIVMYSIFFSKNNFIFYKKSNSNIVKFVNFKKPLTIKSIINLSNSFLIDLFLLCSNFKKLYIYMHNFSSFDSVVLLNFLKYSYLFLKNTSLKLKNNTFYEISIFDKIYLRDSFKLLNLSISDLLINFYPHISYNKKINSLFFFSIFFFFNNIKLLKNYCLYDSLVLYYSLYKLDTSIFFYASARITDGLSTSSLSFSIFRKFYYISENIAQSSAFSPFSLSDINNSFRGGIVQIFKYSGDHLFFYDLNSSYPFSMLSYMPVGLPVKKLISTHSLEKFFGFLTVKVFVKKSSIPFLGVRDKSLLLNTYPTGSFTLSVFSEELLFSLQIGQTKVLKIYSSIKFNKGLLFNDFVNDFFYIKKNSNSSSGRIVAKSLLNNLYGRFAIKNSFKFNLILNKNQYNFISLIFNVSKIFKLFKKNLWLVSIDSSSLNLDFEHTSSSFTRSQIFLLKKIKSSFLNYTKYSIAAPHISSAIASYSRINLYKYVLKIFKNGGRVWYMDTDALVSNIFLTPSSYLGKISLLYTIKKAFFLAPKVYILLLYNTNKIVLKYKSFSQTFYFGDFLLLIKKLIYAYFFNNFFFFLNYYAFIEKNINTMKVYSEGRVTKKTFSFSTFTRKKIFSYKGILVDSSPPHYKDGF